MLHLDVEEKSWPLIRPFTISRGSRNAAKTIIVTLRDEQGNAGRGEAVPYARYDETIPAALAELEAAGPAIEAGITHADIPRILAMRAARNALDCALWDLRARQQGEPVWRLAGLDEPRPLVTAYTISLDTPGAMAARAKENAFRPLLKLKLGAGTAEDDIARMRAVRKAAPKTRIIIDANEAWRESDLPALFTAAKECAVELIEQPLPAGRDACLAHILRPLLKLKLGAGTAEDDIARMRAVRKAAPKTRIIIDANEAWRESDLPALFAAAKECAVELIEQPLPAGKDACLAHIPRPVPLCADESAHGIGDLEKLKPLYDAINIKLDKTGGLTPALALAREARAAGFSLMTGCMLASSLAMAPAFLVAQLSDWADLDGPLLLAEDAQPAMNESGGLLNPPAPALWG